MIMTKQSLLRMQKVNREKQVLRLLLEECLADYSHPQFTDRYGMADRIRNVLNQIDAA
jgi:hypothetical protein